MNNYRTIQQKDMQKLFPAWEHNIPTLGNKCSQPGNKTGLRFALSLLLMFVLGINTAWGQGPVEITTDADGNGTIEDSEKKFYLIQTNAFPSFYIAPQDKNNNNNWTITTNNILGEYMLWYFLDAGTDGDTQYFYIVNKSTEKYIYNHNGTYDGKNGGSGDKRQIKLIDLGSLSDNDKEKCKFKFVVDNEGGTTGFYNIDVKASQTYYGLNKQSGSHTNDNPIRLTNDQYIHDSNSKWKFVPYNGSYTWPDAPFESSTDLDKHFYKIHKVQNKDNYYVSTDETPDKVTYASTESDRMVWYLKEASSDSWFKYYYIINPSTGDRYMYYNGIATNGENQTDAVCVKEYDSEYEDRYQFVVIQAARGDGASRVECYAIIPKLLSKTFWGSNSIGSASVSDDGTSMGIISSRGGGENNTAQWIFETTSFSTECANPTITFSTETGKASISATTTFSIIRYTLDGTPPSSTEGTVYTAPFDVTEETTIKAIVTKNGFTDSEVITKTIYKVATPNIQDNGNHAVSITSETESATIYYTIDGSDPTTSSTVYSGPLTENISGVTIKAIAVKDGMINSAIGSGSVTLSCATPVFTKNGNNLTISCSFPTGAVIYYTTNGEDPTSSSSPYTSPISVGPGDVIKAIAIASGYNNSDVITKTIYDDLTPTDGKYLINSQTDFEKFVDMVSTTERATYHYILKTNVDAGSPITEPFTGVFEVDADENGNFYTISGLTHPLFNTINGGVVKNVMLKNVKIEQSGNVGAIAGEASGYTRIYNCGILPSSNKYENEVSYVKSTTTSGENTGYCGGLVGWLKDDSRVINCFSYANIKGGTTVAGIVGYNNFASTAEESDGKYTKLKTAVVNCMFYGNITGGAPRYPVYGGEKIQNNTETGINNYDFYRAEANLGLADDGPFNCSWPAKEEYLTKYEFYRYLLNSNRELCGWWVGAPSAPSGMPIADVQAVPKDATLMAKWVLDPGIAPYPILKPAGKYYSVINQDPDNRVNPVSKAWESRPTSSNTIMTKAAPDTEGQKLGSITVKINKGGSLSGSSSKNIPITAMDIENNDFCYGKIQLPYYNSIFGDPNSSDWATRYGGNYEDKVVIGWEITSATGNLPDITNNSGTGYDHTYSTNVESGYNFTDRYCTTKDGNRVFAQGGYYYVPYGVSNITITAKWATAIYLDNNDHYYDRISLSSVDDQKDPPISTSSLSPFEPAGKRPTTLGNEKTVQTGTVKSKIPSGGRVYENAIVLVGNHQEFAGGNNVYNDKTSGCTIMSADFDLDDEPDNCLIWELGVGTSRYDMCPIRFDFLPVVEMGLAMKEDGSTQYYALGCYRPLGHYEVTETSLIHFGQFEFGTTARNNSNYKAPLILNGGIYDQYTKGTAANDKEDYITYIIIGGNVRIPSFTPGAHPSTRDAAKKSTRHCPVNVMGGNIDYLYLTGNYNDNIKPNADNPHCYIDGGNFKQVAAAGKEGINGNVFFNINHSVIQEFYGGSTMDQADGDNFKIVKGNIDVTIGNSMVTKYCGGPKFGSMLPDKTVTTRASGTTFGVYYGGGNGGTSYVQYSSTDVTVKDVINGSYSWYTTTGDNGKLNSYNPGTYYKINDNDEKGIGYKANYEMEIVNPSTGTVPKQGVFRTYFYAAQFSATNTGSITNNLTDCQVLTNFYGAGNLGGVIGNVTSTLTNTEVTGSAFGAGYSASVPEVTIYDTGKTLPAINVYTSIITPTPEGDGSSKTYTWTNETSLGGQTLSTSNPAVENVNGKNYFYTEEPLVNLGAVSGAVTLTINGNSNMGHDVFGGGDSSAVINTTNPANASTTVKLQGNAQVQGNVFGGGNRGLVSGTATVNVEQ